MIASDDFREASRSNFPKINPEECGRVSLRLPGVIGAYVVNVNYFPRVFLIVFGHGIARWADPEGSWKKKVHRYLQPLAA